MSDFNSYLDSTGEVGYVEKIFQVLIYVNGLPGASVSELVVFETGKTGQVLSLTEDYVEVLLLSNSSVSIGTKVSRTGKQLNILVGPHLLGQAIDPLGSLIHISGDEKNKAKLPDPKVTEARPINTLPMGINGRKNIEKAFETGVSLVDVVVPLGKGQRELVVGDRKTGKTPFLLQCTKSAFEQGMKVVYAGIAKKRADIFAIDSYFKKHGMTESSVIVATSSSEPASMVYLTPYTAMTIAEYFRDQGNDVLIVLDDMTTHAKYYREITLLAKRFPGRSSYPGDIFHVHASLIERAGNFILNKKNVKGEIERKEVSITCLPVAEIVLGDLSGYIQTNLMSMTDGHIYFDIDLFNEGRRPAVNPFLSVTRVGRQAQTSLSRDLTQKITRFLIHLRDLEQFMHFGTELTEKSKQDLALGARIRDLFNQSPDLTIPLNITIMVIAGIWLQVWKDVDSAEQKKIIENLISKYRKDKEYKDKIDTLLAKLQSFDALLDEVKGHKSIVDFANT